MINQWIWGCSVQTNPLGTSFGISKLTECFAQWLELELWESSSAQKSLDLLGDWDHLPPLE